MRKLPFQPKNVFRRVAAINWPGNAVSDKQSRFMIPFLVISLFIAFVWLLNLTSVFQDSYRFIEFLSVIGLGGSFWLFVRLSRANKKLDLARQQAKEAEL